MNCSRCLITLAKSQPVHLVAGLSLCATCCGKSRYATAVFIVRSCTQCGRPMKILPTNRSKHCSGACRSSAFGLGTARR